MMPKKKYNTIDLFAGCGGLMDGFMQEGGYNTLACVEWESFPCETLANRLEKDGIIRMQKKRLLGLTSKELKN